MNQKEIGRRIKSIRQSKNITREELAKKLDVSYSSIEKHEQGLRGFKIETINKFAEALEVSAEEILGMSVVSNDIGAKIKSAKILRGLNDEELSKLTGISESQLRAIQDGRINPTKSELNSITKALDLSDNYFEKDSPISIDEDGNILDKYNIDELQIKFSINKANMNHEELCTLIYFYQNRNLNLVKKLKALEDKKDTNKDIKEEEKMAHVILDTLSISKEYNYLNFFLDESGDNINFDKIKSMFNTLVNAMKFICDSSDKNK